MIYDGECGFCRRSADLVRSWDRNGRLDYVPFQDEAAVARFGVELPALAAAMHVSLPDGRVFAGAEAAPEIVRLLPGKGWMALPFRVPGAMPLARRLYAWIAARRRCVVRFGPPGYVGAEEMKR